MLRPLPLAIATTLSALSLATAASAAVPGYSFTGGFASFSPTPVTTGFGFTTLKSITVTDLGSIDFGLDGLSAATPVGLWNDSGTLLGSSTIPAGTDVALVGKFRYVSITPVTLAANTTYWVGAQAASEVYESNVTATPGPDLTIVEDGSVTYFANGAGLNFPKVSLQLGTLAIANFQYVVAPEPGSLAALALGGFALRRRRK